MLCFDRNSKKLDLTEYSSYIYKILRSPTKGTKIQLDI